MTWFPLPAHQGHKGNEGRRVKPGRPAPPAELVIVNLVTQHNEQPHEELAGHGDFGFGASAPMPEGAVDPLEVGIQAGGMPRGLPEDEAQERTALLGDAAEVIFLGRGVQGRSEAD